MCIIILMNQSIWELYFIDLPFFCNKSAFYMASKSLTWLWIPCVFEIVITNWELGIRLFNIGVINNTDITASKNRAFLRIACYRKLSQVQVKSLTQIYRKYKRTHWFICCPMLFARIPSQRSITAYRFSILSFNKSNGFSDIVTSFMEL